jgi:cobalt-zinc-cadmium resistance protein CzcA
LDSIYASLADAAILRQKTGEGTGLERIAAEAQRRQLTNQIAQLQQDFLGQQQILMQWIHEEILVLPPNTPLSKIKIDKRGELGAWHPVLLAAKQQITIAEQAQVVERKKNLPDFSGRVFSQALYGMKNPFNGFSLSVNVPVFSKPKVRNQLALLATELEKAKFEHQSHLFSASQRLAITELTRAETALKFYETEGKQQANDILAAATLSYKSGEISYPELSQYLVQAIDIHKNYLMVLNEYNQAAIQYLFYFYP